jgi:putative ABC transport system permease protein
MIVRMAWRNIWRNRARSLIIIASIMLGLIAGLLVLAIYRGMMKSRIRTVIEREVGHVQMHHRVFKDDFMASYTLPQAVNYQLIKSMPEVKFMAQRSITPAMLATANGSAGIMVCGIDTAEERHISQLDKKLVHGNYFDGNIRHPILIGKKLADKMKLKLRSKLVLMFTDTANNLVSAAFRVAGIFESENAPLDERTAYVQRDLLNGYLGIGKGSHEAVFILQRDEDLAVFKEKLMRKWPELLVERWEDLSPETELMADVTNQYSLIIIIIIMLALAFGIINTMLMAILERVREIGMMLALGMNKAQLFTLVLCETVFLTLAGCPLGLLISWILIEYMGRKGFDFSSNEDELMKSFGFSNRIFPEFPYSQMQEVILVVIITSLVSSILPSIKALKLTPVEALRK